jgi:signal transduction histidine kinase
MRSSNPQSDPQTTQAVPGLVELIESLVEHNQAVGVEVRFKVHGEPRRLLPELELALYHAVEEGLTNVRRHAEASRVLLDLEFLPSIVRVLLQDNGRGANDPAEESEPGGSGLLALQEQVRRLGGQMLIHTAVGEGFNLVIELPG